MRIITISRQFGSGGRELGKRMSDVLGWDYYDREIIERLSSNEGLDKEYINRILTNHEWNTLPITFRSSFSQSQYTSGMKTALLIKQRKIIEDIAASGNDCIIVGRDADIILSDYRPLRIFVCADMSSRIARCMRFEEKKSEGERLSEREVKKNILRIDKGRSQTREILTGKAWGDSESFDISINTAGWSIPKLASAIPQLALRWFEED